MVGSYQVRMKKHKVYLIVLQDFDPRVIREDIRPRHGKLGVSGKKCRIFRKIHCLLGGERPPYFLAQRILRVHFGKGRGRFLKGCVKVIFEILFPISRGAVDVEQHAKHTEHRQNYAGT